MLPRQSFDTFSSYLAGSFTFPVGTATIAGSDRVPVVTPAATTLAPGESTTFNYTLWREKNTATGGYLGFTFPNIVVGTVECP